MGSSQLTISLLRSGGLCFPAAQHAHAHKPRADQRKRERFDMHVTFRIDAALAAMLTFLGIALFLLLAPVMALNL